MKPFSESGTITGLSDFTIHNGMSRIPVITKLSPVLGKYVKSNNIMTNMGVHCVQNTFSTILLSILK